MARAPLKYTLLLGLSVALSLTTVIFGALPMLAIRQAYGRLPFWTGLVAVSAALALTGLPSYGLLVLALAIAIGVFGELEEQGESIFGPGAVAILAALGSSALVLGLWMYRANAPVVSSIRSQLEPLVERLTTMNAEAGVTVDAVLQQLPSGFVIALIAALAIALIGADKLKAWFSLSSADSVVEKRLPKRLLEFRVPDALVWVAILAVFGAFFQHGIGWLEAVSMNALNVMVVLYFFQGLAVVASAFQTFKVGTFWQGIWYIILVLQLFLLVAMVGFADFWIEFRQRLARKPAETNRGF